MKGLDRKVKTEATIFPDTSLRKYHFNPDTELGQIYAELKFISERMRARDFDNECQDNWKYVSSVFDR